MLTSKKEGSSDAEAGKIAAKPTGLSKQELVSFLRDAKLRPTRQRISLAKILYSKGDRHVTAELLHDEAQMAGMPVSLATVYNALRQFSEAGLLRAIAVDSSRTFFDTNTGDHHHFFIEESGEVVDVPHDGIVIDNIPNAPRDLQISGVDVIIRLRPVG
ncbi:MAG: iron response transcriptional regulator IrrA [Pseudomonadota bacterium]